MNALVNFSLACIILLTASFLSAQSRKPPDAAILRTKFNAAFEKDFDLIKDEMKIRAVERGGGTYWLAFVKPKRTGYFYLQYRYPESDHLDIREHEIRFSIGPEKCRRGGPSSGVYGRFCLGDTIIVPVLVNNYAGHEFKLTKAEYTDEKEDATTSTTDSSGLDTSPVNNPALPTLRYAGRESHKSLHRSLGYTLNLNAEFVAASPGRMNLLVTASDPGNAETRGHEGVPIVVLPFGAPATLIAGREELRGYRIGFDGREYLASTSGNSYMTHILILQPGDRISARYFSIVRGSEFERRVSGADNRDPSESLMPVIKVRSFLPDTRYDFTEWIVDYLPK
ncbi:MAG: hypothetical protein ACXW3C_03890 [Pyrinomonadaceae bacterium]